MSVMKAPDVGSVKNAGERYGRVTCSVPGSITMFGQAP